MKNLISFCLSLILLFQSGHALAQTEVGGDSLPLSSKIAVFPISDLSGTEAEEAWWQMRELLTKESRFLVATRRLMINRGVFQPRKTLKPADVILLSKILDADLIVTSSVQDRTFVLNVYESNSGQLFFSNKSEFHPALPIKEQVNKVSTKSVSDFIDYLPYDGFVLRSDQKGVVQSENGESLATAKIFQAVSLKEGDPIHVVSITKLPKQVFQIEVVAEGEFVKLKPNGESEIKLIQFKDLKSVNENSFIRVPGFRAKQIEALSPDANSNLTTEYLSQELKTKQQLEKSHTATTSSVWWIINLAAMILLAF